MNLKERYAAVFNNFNSLVLDAAHTNSDHYRINNLNALRHALDELADLQPFEKDVDEILMQSQLFQTGGNEAVFNGSDYNIITRKVAEITNKAQVIIDFYGEDLSTGDDVLEIKLPQSATSFEELSKVAGQLKAAFERPVHSMGIEGGVVEIISAEPGSIWLIVKFGAALSFVAKLINKAIFVNNEMQKSAANDTYLKQIGASQETLEQMQQLAVKHLQVVTEAQAKEIAEGTVKANDPEVIRTLEMALKTIGELQDKGAKFLPASKDPNVISMFPKADAAQLPFDPAKQLA
ncbi:MAG: hypothetical protein V4450_07405 [Bacteroidota bacterium]